MLEYKLTPNHAGLALWGDYGALHRTYELVHRVVGESPLIEDEESFVLGLAYDLRKAFTGERSKAKRTQGAASDRCVIYGVEILWPVILVQLALLRHAMVRLPVTKLEEAIMLELEQLVETALWEATPGAAEDILRLQWKIRSMPCAHVDAILDSRCLYFIELDPKDRLGAIASIMASFDPSYGRRIRRRVNSPASATPAILFADGDRDWPDFEW